MTSSSSERPLGSFETAQAITSEHRPYNLVAVLGLTGEVPGKRLAAALERVQRRHPLLRAATAGSQRRRTIRVLEEAAPIPLTRRERTDGTSWIEVAERELVTPFDLGRAPLARCVEVAPAAATGDSELVCVFPHLLVDGVAAAEFVHDLLAAILGREREDAGPDGGDLPPPAADERFPAAYRLPARRAASAAFLARQAADEIAWRWRTRGARRPPASPDTVCRILPLTLDGATSTALVHAGRRRRLTLANLAQAAMLLAVVRRRYPDRTLPHRFFVFPLLRAYLEPPVPAHDFGSYLTTLRLTVDAGPDSDFWKLSADIQERVSTALARGERYLASVWSPQSMRTMLAQDSCRMATSALSYTGPALLRTGDDRLRIRALHAFVSNFWLGPEFTAQVRLFQGRMWWDFLYLDYDMEEAEARQLAEDTLEILRRAAEERS